VEEAELTGREGIGGHDQVLVDEGSGSWTPCRRLLELPHRYLTNNLSLSFLFTFSHIVVVIAAPRSTAIAASPS
jgi:hypothetical protein